MAWTSTAMLICSRSQSVQPKNCSLTNYPAPPLHMQIRCSCPYTLYTPVSVVLKPALVLTCTHQCLWSALVPSLVSAIWRRTCRANLQPRNAQRARSLADTRPQLINLPNQYVMGSEEGSVGVAAGTFATSEKKVGNLPLLRTFFLHNILRA